MSAHYISSKMVRTRDNSMIFYFLISIFCIEKNFKKARAM